eukprot:2846887-Pyramimonas_sp.AAC.1
MASSRSRHAPRLDQGAARLSQRYPHMYGCLQRRKSARRYPAVGFAGVAVHGCTILHPRSLEQTPR